MPYSGDINWQRRVGEQGSLRASSPIWANEARRVLGPSLACSRWQASSKVACSRLRWKVVQEKEMRKTRGGWGATAPFPKSRASYFCFASFNTSALYYTRILYYLRTWQRLGVRMTLSLHCFSRPCLRLTVVNRNVYPVVRLRSGEKKAKKRGETAQNGGAKRAVWWT